MDFCSIAALINRQHDLRFYVSAYFLDLACEFRDLMMMFNAVFSYT